MLTCTRQTDTQHTGREKPGPFMEWQLSGKSPMKSYLDLSPEKSGSQNSGDTEQREQGSLLARAVFSTA